MQGKKIILIDDSIVRGTTMRALVTNLKEWSGAKEVHLRIGCPPITSPCFYGIDFPTINELYAGAKEPEAKDFNADSLHYLSLSGLLKALNKDKDESCLNCLYTERDETLLSCDGIGVLSPVVGIMGSMMAMECIKTISGLNKGQKNIVSVFDFKNNIYDRINLEKRVNCDICS